MLRNTTRHFGSISKLLHWFVFVLLTAQFLFIWQYNISFKGSPEKLHYMLLHKSVGITVLIFGIVFIIWRIINKQPLPPETQPGWKRIAAKIVHNSLLILIVIMPVLGYLLSCAAGRAVSFFGLFTLPSLIPENKNLTSILDFAHEKLGFLILILVGIHVLAAFHHHFILKDNILKRMLPFTKSD